MKKTHQSQALNVIRPLLGCLTAVVIAANAHAATPSELADDFLSSLLKKNTHPGFAALVSKDGKILFQRAYGMADTKAKRANNDDTPFRIGSITKQFTAASILELQEQGKLTVNDPLTKYYPAWPSGEKITLHHLLTHTSGMVSYTSHPRFESQVRKPVDMSKLIQSIQETEANFLPGESFDYCNSGYLLLGLIVEKVSGQSYGDFLRETFFKPLGMSQTGVHQKGSEPEGEALGYTKGLLGLKRANNWDMSWAGGAGAIYSTTGDLHRWTLGIINGKVLGNESLRAAFTPGILNDGTETDYGYGWGIENPGKEPTVMHGGGLDGFTSFMAYSSKRKMTIVVLSNTDTGHDTEAIFLQLATFWAEMETNPDWEIDDTLVGKNYDDYVGRYDYGEATLVVTRKDDQLFSKLGGQPALEILPMAPDEFFLKIVVARVKFERDSNGKVYRVTHFQNGEILKAPRLR